MMLLIQEKIRNLETQLQKLEKEKVSLQEALEEECMKLQKASIKDFMDTSQPLSAEEKIKIFMNLFRGRMDVFPKRWDNSKTGKSGYSPACFNEWIKGKCNKPQIKCSECINQAFIPLTAEIIRKHLGGEDSVGGKKDYTIGIYPMLEDNTCWFLAIDFDKARWQQDAAAFTQICNQKNIPFALERSRSGNGAHIWIFFEHPIQASKARKMGAAILTETMEHYPDLSFESYDRFFPNQDTLLFKGFGNLIALPLQHFPRGKGNSIFLNENFEPYKDQWKFLASLKRMSEKAINQIVDEASCNNKIMNVPMPLDHEEPWDTGNTHKELEILSTQKLPETVNIVLSNQIYIEKCNLPSMLIHKLIRLAAFQNPEFYVAQSMRLSTFGKPRIISCAEDFSQHIGLPRGCLDKCIELFDTLNIKIMLEDKRQKGNQLNLNFLGNLTNEQEIAVNNLLPHNAGVLAATTAFGKTVIGIHMVAKRKTNTLIIVHRRQLLDQWIERLKVFLDIQSDQLGVIRGGKYKPSKIIDVATIQSLMKGKIVNEIVTEYGHIIVDECHHLSAVSFEAIIRACKAQYVLGLTATSTRKDGHHPIIFMQCGPIRYKVDAKKQAKLRLFNHKVILKNTEFSLVFQESSTISYIYSAIAKDVERNQVIIKDVVDALKLGCSPLILTERKEHALFFEQQLLRHCKNVILMVGGQNSKKQAEVKLKLATIPEYEERLIIATGRYIGEGFDDKRLDALFLTMPISWHGTLTQYAGRLHRAHAQKKEVVIYDYVDCKIPMLAKMAEKRMKGYAKIGYIRSE